MSPSASEIAALCERVEARAAESACRAAPAVVARALAIEWRVVGSAVATRVGAVDILAYNRVVGLGIDTPATEPELDAIVEFFRRTGAPRCMVHLSPEAGPRDLPAWLEARGFVLHNRWVRLYRDVRPMDPVRSDLRIAAVGPEHAEAFARLDVEAFGHPEILVPWLATTVGRPGWHHFGAFDGETLVATGALFAAEGAGWLGFASTAARHRGRGAQSALIAARITAAAELGCSWLAVETAEDKPEKPNPSTHNLLRMGFQVAHLRPNWVRKFDLPDP